MTNVRVEHKGNSWILTGINHTERPEDDGVFQIFDGAQFDYFGHSPIMFRGRYCRVRLTDDVVFFSTGLSAEFSRYFFLDIDDLDAARYEFKPMSEKPSNFRGGVYCGSAQNKDSQRVVVLIDDMDEQGVDHTHMYNFVTDAWKVGPRLGYRVTDISIAQSSETFYIVGGARWTASSRALSSTIGLTRCL